MGVGDTSTVLRDFDTLAFVSGTPNFHGKILSNNVGWDSDYFESWACALDDSTVVAISVTQFSPNSPPYIGRALETRLLTRSGYDLTWQTTNRHGDRNTARYWEDSYGVGMGAITLDSTYCVFGHAEYTDNDVSFFGEALALIKRTGNDATTVDVALGWDTQPLGVNFYGYSMCKWDDNSVVTVGDITDHQGTQGHPNGYNIGIEMFNRTGDTLTRLSQQAFAPRFDSDGSIDTNDKLQVDDMACCVVDDNGTKTLIVLAQTTNMDTFTLEARLYAFTWNGSAFVEVANSDYTVWLDSGVATNWSGTGYSAPGMDSTGGNKFIATLFSYNSGQLFGSHNILKLLQASYSGGTFSVFESTNILSDNEFGGIYDQLVKRIPGTDKVVTFFEEGNRNNPDDFAWFIGKHQQDVAFSYDHLDKFGGTGTPPHDFQNYAYVVSIDFFDTSLAIAAVSTNLNNSQSLMIIDTNEATVPAFLLQESDTSIVKINPWEEFIA